METVINWFSQQGILGIVIIALGFALWYKEKEVKRLNKERLKDLKEIQADHIRLETRINETLRLLTAVITRGR